MAVLAVIKAAKDVLCALHYQQDGACMALIATINSYIMHGRGLSNEMHCQLQPKETKV